MLHLSTCVALTTVILWYVSHLKYYTTVTTEFTLSNNVICTDTVTNSTNNSEAALATGEMEKTNIHDQSGSRHGGVYNRHFDISSRINSS